MERLKQFWDIKTIITLICIIAGSVGNYTALTASVGQIKTQISSMNARIEKVETYGSANFNTYSALADEKRNVLKERMTLAEDRLKQLEIMAQANALAHEQMLGELRLIKNILSGQTK